MPITGYSNTISVTTLFDTDAQAFFDRVTTAGGSLSTTEKNAVNTLVVDLKSYSLWSKMKAIYPMVGASAAACAQNLKSSSFTGTFNGGITYASTGVKFNGTTGYMNTAFNASTDFASASRHMAFYNRTNTAKGYDMGAAILPADVMLASRFTGTTAAYTNFGDSAGYTTTTTAATGFFQGNNISNTERLYRNGSQIATRSNTIVNVNMSIYIGASNRSNVAVEFTEHECAFSSIGDGLDATEASNFYTAVNAFQVSLSRNV